MKEKVFEVIKSKSGSISYKNIAKKIDIDTEKLKKILLELKLEGKILQLGNKYSLFPEDLMLGTVIVSSSGNKYLYHDDEKISIASNFLSELILHDVVSFKVNDNNEADIVSIVDRPLGIMTCEVVEFDGKKKIIPYHNDMHVGLPSEVMDELYVGDIITVKLTPNEMFEYCNAKFIKKIGRIDDPSHEDLIDAINYGFDNDYSQEYLDEVSKYPTEVSLEECVGRVDYRYQDAVTIDGINTKDMDDGCYALRLDNGIIRAYVHIAHVSHYVDTNSLVFERACEKTTSLYLNNSVFHMLHHIISKGICSLNPNVDRLTLTIVMDISEDGDIINFDIVRSVINSKKKMNYDDVDQILLYDIVPSGYENFVSLLFTLNEASDRLEKRYTKNGKLSFANNENNITYNSDGSIKNISVMGNSPGRKLIENLMVAANETMANWFYNMGIPTVYRVHELPDITKINNLIRKLNQSGYKIKNINNVTDAKSIQIMLDKLRNYEEFAVISQLFVMKMQRAGYSTSNYGHYGLGLDAYLHGTSPIRRLPDLLVQKMCDIVFDHYDKLTSTYLDEIYGILNGLAKHASKMQRQADVAEMTSEKRAIIKKLEKMVGMEIEGVICDTDQGIKIRFFGIDAYVDGGMLGNNFHYDNKRKLFYDVNTGVYLSIGTNVIVKLLAANSSNRSVKIVISEIVNKNVKKKILVS